MLILIVVDSRVSSVLLRMQRLPVILHVPFLENVCIRLLQRFLQTRTGKLMNSLKKAIKRVLSRMTLFENVSPCDVFTVV